MNDCQTCARERIRSQRPYRSVPRQMRYSAGEPVERGRSPNRYNPNDCKSCCVTQDLCETYPFDSIFSPVCCSPPSCPDTACYCCPSNSEYGFLSTLRNGFQRIFSGTGSRKRNCPPPMCKDKVYRYSASQLRMMEKLLSRLEDDATCVDEAIKEAIECNFRANILNLKCSVNNISDQVAALKCDLNCALDCYDPCRDKCEYELICLLKDRANCLESFLYDLCLQLDCLECRAAPCVPNCYKPCCVKSPVCKPNCKKPCCYRPMTFCPPPQRYKPCRPCDIPCRKPASPKPHRDGKCQKPCCVRKCRKEKLCKTSSVIPLGVMLVRL